MAYGFSSALRRSKIPNLASGRTKGMPVKFSQTLSLLVRELLLNFMKAKLLMGVKLIG